MRLAPEGWPFVLAGAGITLILALAGWMLGSLLPGWLRLVLFWGGGAVLLLTFFTLFFFRNPEPSIPPREDRVVAPGEGRVVQIVQVEEPEYLQGPATRISIFLTVFNVHLQRAPLSGEVEYVRYNPGKYLAAWNPKASELNEQASIGIRTRWGKIMVRQIAGLVARRVVTDPTEGDEVERGRRIGLIRFGSRVDLFLPPAWELTCQEGDGVRVGETVLALAPPEVHPEGETEGE